VVQQNKHEQMLNLVEKIILSRKLKPGDRLPPERELQERYRIGRGTVREALRALQQKGLIEIKKGAKGGAFVKELDSEHVSETLAVLIRHGRISMKHLAEFREVVEAATAAHAAERASPEDIQKIKKLLEELTSLLNSEKKDLKKFYQCELSMHKELARISRNPIFEWISGTLYISMEPLSFHLNKNRIAHSEVLADWRDIIEAIENGEVMKVASIVRVHIARYRRFMEEEARKLPRD